MPKMLVTIKRNSITFCARYTWYRWVSANLEVFCYCGKRDTQKMVTSGIKKAERCTLRIDRVSRLNYCEDFLSKSAAKK